jgi:hypothetical protein
LSRVPTRARSHPIPGAGTVYAWTENLSARSQNDTQVRGDGVHTPGSPATHRHR